MRVRWTHIVGLVGASTILGVLGVAAADDTKAIKLNGFDEVPVVISGATGLLRLEIPKDESSIAYALTWEGIEGGNVLQAHIHLGQQHTTGQIVVFLCTNIGGAPVVPPPNDTPPCPSGANGEVSGTLIPANVIPRPAQGVGTDDLAAVIEAIRNGVAYGNVHTDASPSGEIRGQFRGSH